MRKIFTILVFLGLALVAFSQVPNKVNYQAVLRDASGTIKANTGVTLGVSILQGSATGTEVFAEDHAVTTNEFGLINIEIGSVNSAAFGAIDWSNGPYFLKVSVDGTSLGTSQILSVPYALYSSKAKYAETADYTKLTNAPDFTGWDQNASDDFDGKYSSLIGAPNAYWTQVDTNLYYNTGSVGINIGAPSNFGGSALQVGGAIRYAGLPTDTSAGMLFYDPQADGTFKYVDNTGTVITLGTGDITYTGTYEANVSGDIIRPNDYIINGSMEIGVDAVNNYSFGFNTLVFAENNLRILFDDTDTLPGYPNNDWQIEINESANGGTNHFAINDVTSGTTPFKVMAGAPNNSLFVASDGKVGIGTNTPTNELTVEGSIKATSFIGDGSGITGITGSTGGISNVDNTTIAADTDADNVGEMVFQTKNSTRMIITNDGKIGIGTATPSTDIDVVGTGKFQNLEINGSLTLSSFSLKLNTDNTAGPATLDYDVINKNMVTFSPSSGPIVIEGFTSGIAGQELTIINNGSQTLTFNHNGTGTQKILLAGAANLVLTQLAVATFICDGTAWYCVSLNK